MKVLGIIFQFDRADNKGLRANPCPVRYTKCLEFTLGRNRQWANNTTGKAVSTHQILTKKFLGNLVNPPDDPD